MKGGTAQLGGNRATADRLYAEWQQIGRVSAA
jgi:hypothetical protein